MVDVAIAAVAAKQRGNITRPQLLSLGLDDGGIAWRVKVGRLYRVFRGVYSVGRPPGNPHDWAGAAVLAAGPGAALSHGSAMTLWTFWRRWDRPYEVIVVGDRRTRGVTVHRSMTLRRREVTTQLGVRTTTPARTIFDVTPWLDDKRLKGTVNRALGTPWLTEGQLAEVLGWHPHAPATPRLARLIGLPGTPTRSGWEDEFPEFCARHGLPEPVMGVPLFGYIVDALFPRERVIVELDSREFHMGTIPFEGDRDRDADMLAGGFVTVRITHQRMDARPREEAERLHTILANQRALHAPRAA